MRRALFLLFLLSAISSLAAAENNGDSMKDGINMAIRVTANDNVTVFELNGSTAAQELYKQLPLTVKVEDFSSNEKIFYPPQKLGTSGTPKANAKRGSLSYYAPWGDVVMFYEDFGSASGLYELGNCISGIQYIELMSGTVLIEKN